ncbi:hypothetical protein B0H14DRAFT_3470947 [Mycena olivaceomarginata]|nr:hypothetical protein B0H14DRAFT_3470947 [Mycena olivaceomarginata]
MSRLHPYASAPATPLAPSNDASPAAPPASPCAFAFGATIYLRNSPHAGKIHTLRITSRLRLQRPPRPAHIHHHVLVHAPRWAIMIMRLRPISMSFWFFGDCFLHTRT